MSKGIVYILLSVAVYALLHFSTQANALTTRALVTTFFGATAFIFMAWAIVLATRPRWLESSFNGLDRMYQVHKFLGVSVLLLILLHFIGLPKLDLSEREAAQGLAAITGLKSSALGMLSMVLLVLSVVLSLNRKIAYQTWLKPHRMMGIVFFITALHMLHSPAQLFNGQSLAGAVLLLVGLVGFGAYIYRQTKRNKHALPYTVQSVKRFDRATELSLIPNGHDGIKFESGQFGFITIDQNSLKESHPFTFSSSPNEPKLRITMKVLGDFTRRIREAELDNTAALVEGPYGRFSFAKGGQHQLWVAGGIGITPFLSEIRSLQEDDTRQITLFYCARDRADENVNHSV